MEQKESFVSNLDNIPNQFVSLLKNRIYNRYRFDAFVLSNQKVIDAIKDADDRGADITGHVGTHARNKIDGLKGVDCVPGNHGKNWVACEKSPSGGDPGKCAVYVGSEQPTNYAYGNRGVGVMIENDKNLFLDNYHAITSTSPEKEQKTIITDTPVANKTYSSKAVDLNESRALRIAKTAKKTDKERHVYVRSMNWNDETVTQAMVDAAKSGADVQLLVNRSALTREGTEQLKEMGDAGAQVKVFDPAGKKRNILHAKDIIRVIGDDDYMYLTSNANITQKGVDEKNLETIIPKNKEITLAAINDFKRVQKECVALDEAVPLYEEYCNQQKEKKSKKRKLSFNGVEDQTKTKKSKKNSK